MSQNIHMSIRELYMWINQTYQKILDDTTLHSNTEADRQYQKGKLNMIILFLDKFKELGIVEKN